jgi:hypothetical protein
MTRAEWLASSSSHAMLAHVRAFADARRLRLFACACCRQVWNRFIDPVTVGVVSVAEAFADGGVPMGAFALVRERANAAATAAERRADLPAYHVHVARAAAHACADDAAAGASGARLAALHAVSDFPITGPYMASGLPAEYLAEMAGQADLLRDIFGPDPAAGRDAFDPAWLTPDVRALARAIYERRDSAAVPVLGDALEEAGCDDAELLDHCRAPGEHVRGCWAVEMFL